jgi:hypothetical protein
MPRVLLVAGDATESLDTWYPYHRLREEGIEVHIGAPARKVLNSVIHDFEPGWDTYVEKPGYRIPADVAFADIEPGDYDAIILSGGRAPEYLRNDPQLQKIVRHFVARKKPIAALCHGSHPCCRRCRPWPHCRHLRGPGPGHRTRRGQVQGHGSGGGREPRHLPDLDGPAVLHAGVPEGPARFGEGRRCETLSGLLKRLRKGLLVRLRSTAPSDRQALGPARPLDCPSPRTQP